MSKSTGAGNEASAAVGLALAALSKGTVSTTQPDYRTPAPAILKTPQTSRADYIKSMARLPWLLKVQPQTGMFGTVCTRPVFFFFFETGSAAQDGLKLPSRRKTTLILTCLASVSQVPGLQECATIPGAGN